MHFDHSKIFVTKFALKFTEFQKFQPSARPSAFSCIDLRQPKAKPKVRNLRLRPKTFGRPLDKKDTDPYNISTIEMGSL